METLKEIEGVDSGKLSGAKGDTAKTFYIGSKEQPYLLLPVRERKRAEEQRHTDRHQEPS